MRKWKIIFILCMVILGLSGIATTASAGTEPSPFRSDANKLDAMKNNLRSIEKRLKDTLPTPPDPVRPGTANKLGAMNNELDAIEKRLEDMHLKREVNTGAIQENYVVLHEQGHEILSLCDEYLPDPGYWPETVIHELREMHFTISNIITQVEDHIRPTE